MKRRKVNIADAPRVAGVEEWWQVEIENMGWCKDGTPCVTYKY